MAKCSRRPSNCRKPARSAWKAIADRWNIAGFEFRNSRKLRVLDHRNRAIDRQPRGSAQDVSHYNGYKHGRPAIMLGDIAEQHRRRDEAYAGHGVVERKHR